MNEVYLFNLRCEQNKLEEYAYLHPFCEGYIQGGLVLLVRARGLLTALSSS
jgi:hypothetical protein